MVERRDAGRSDSQQYSSVRDCWFWKLYKLQRFITTKLLRSHCTHICSPFSHVNPGPQCYSQAGNCYTWLGPNSFSISWLNPLTKACSSAPGSARRGFAASTRISLASVPNTSNVSAINRSRGIACAASWLFISSVRTQGGAISSA
jgi:hypothetical protein